MAQDFLSQLFGGQPDYSQFISPQQSQQAQSNALTSAGLNAAIALLGASGQTNRPVSTGQVLGTALSAGLGGYQSSFDNQLRQMLAQGQLSDIQDKRVLREQQIKDIRTKELAQQQLTAALALPDPIAKIDALRALGRFDLVKDLAEGQIKVRQSGLGRPVGEAEAPSPFTPYLTSQSPEVRIQAQQYDQGFRSGRITEDMVDRLTPALATMQASFNQQLESRADRLSREKREANERADKRLEGKKPTESEQKAYGFAQRMELSDQLLTNLENQVLKEGLDTTVLYPTATSQAAGKVPLIGDYLRTQVTSPVQQQYRQAQENWVRANLRKESGAVIGSDEMADEIRTYFPQPGESAQVIQQKQIARQVTQDAMKTSAGALYRPFDLKQFKKDRGLE
jgi:hypothetical protein